MKTAFVILFAVIAVTNAAVDLPKALKPCKRSDPNHPECLKTSVIAFIRSIGPNGLQAWKIPPCEPLSVNGIKIGSLNGPVSLSQEYHDVKLHGLTQGIQITDYKVDWKNRIFESETLNPQVDFVANYKVKGKVLVLPVNGNGQSNITMLNVRSKNKVRCEAFQKNGETYWKVKDYDIEFFPGKVIMNFENLFDGDKALGDQMNKFLNENSAVVFNELKPDYQEAFGQVFAKIANGVFTNVPINQLSPQ